MADTSMNHHHHHHHHSKRRSKFLRKALRDSIFVAICVVAALAMLLVMYCGMRDNPNLGHLMILGLPVFAVIGALVGIGNYLFARRAYDKDRQ